MVSGQSPLVTQRWLHSVPQEGQINQGEKELEAEMFLFILILSQFYEFSILTRIAITHFHFSWLLLGQRCHTAVSMSLILHSLFYF